jgi:hypothetical protein
MGKNTGGGSRHKKQAKKNMNVAPSSRLRVAKEEGEIYAKVIKINGNSMADVLCEDKQIRLLIIRRKFKGRHKRDNGIAVNQIILVGRRLWEVVSSKKKQKVDLLYVYSSGQLSELRQRVNIQNFIMPSIEEEEEETGFEITSKHDWKNEETMLGSVQKADDKNKKSDNKNKKIGESEDICDLDFDDI